MSSNVVSIHVGSAGCGIGDASWKLYALEHGLGLDGCISRPLDDEEAVHMWRQHAGIMLSPFGVFVDVDGDGLDEIRTGPTRQLYHPDNLINASRSGSDGTGGNWARGYGAAGHVVIERVMDRVRYMADHFDAIGGFIINDSLDGGTGGGLGTLIQERLAVDYPRKSLINATMMTHTRNEDQDASVLQPYNTVMSLWKRTTITECMFSFNNAALRRVLSELDVQRPPHATLNQLVAHAMSGLTQGVRWAATLNTTLDDITRNLVVYPTVNLCTCAGVAPLYSIRDAPETTDMEIGELLGTATTRAFEGSYDMAGVELMRGKFMGACTMFRGNVVPKHISMAIAAMKVKRTIQFVDWVPTGFKCGIVYSPRVDVPDAPFYAARHDVSLTTLANNSAIDQPLTRIARAHDRMFRRRAGVHWLVAEGIEEAELVEAREALASRLQDYREVVMTEEITEDVTGAEEY